MRLLGQEGEPLWSSGNESAFGDSVRDWSGEAVPTEPSCGNESASGGFITAGRRPCPTAVLDSGHRLWPCATGGGCSPSWVGLPGGWGLGSWDLRGDHDGIGWTTAWIGTVCRGQEGPPGTASAVEVQAAWIPDAGRNTGTRIPPSSRKSFTQDPSATPARIRATASR